MSTSRYPKLKYSIICDDIRREIGGKISLMGGCFNEIIVPVIPTVIPKLCFHLVFTPPKVKTKVKLNLYNPENEKQPGFPEQSFEIDVDDVKKKRLILDFEFGGFILRKAGMHKIIIDFEGASKPEEINFEVKVASQEKETEPKISNDLVASAK